MQHNNFAISEKSDTFAFLNQKVYPSRAHFQTWSTRPLRCCAYASKPRTTSIRSQTPTGNRNSTPARMAESVDALVSNTSGAIRAGSIPAPGTHKCKCLIFKHLHFSFYTTVAPPKGRSLTISHRIFHLHTTLLEFSPSTPYDMLRMPRAFL